MKLTFLLDKLTAPVKSHFVFFFISFLTLVPNTLKNLIAQWNIWEEWIINLKYFSLAFLFAYIVTLIVYLSHSKLVKYLFYFIDIVVVVQFIFLWIALHTSFGPYHVMLIAETNTSETAEFFQQFVYTKAGLITFFSTVALIGTIILFERITKNKISKFLSVACKLIIPIVLIIGIYNCNIYMKLFRCSTEKEMTKWAADEHTFPMDYVTTMLFSFYSPVALTNENKLAVDKTKEAFLETVSIQGVDTLNIIYVLGESFIKYHSPLYGYSLNTTPFMRKECEEGRLFAFTDAISNQRYTLPAEKNTYSCNSLIHGEHFYDAPFFPSLFKKAGYDVYFWDAQKFWAAGSQFTFSINSYLYCKDISNISYNDTNKKTINYDKELIEDFFSQHKKLEGKRNLIMFHLFGQHFVASERYPNSKENKVFHKEDIPRKDLSDSQRQDIADYDNAIKYSDDIVRQLANRFHSEPTVIIYTSDHGEEMYDFRHSKGRVECPNDLNNFLKYQCDVPFFVWCSDTFKERFPDKVEKLERSVGIPFSTDNLCQILFDLGGVRSTWSKPERNILSGKYLYIGRKVEEKYDYDKIRNLHYNENGIPLNMPN